MRRVALLMLALGMLLPGTAYGSTAHHTKVVYDCQHARYKPSYIVLFCDQTLALTKIVYSSWTNSVAKGSDRTVTDDCNPNCAAGTNSYQHDHFILDRAKTKGGVTVFTRARVYHHGKLLQTYPLSYPN